MRIKQELTNFRNQMQITWTHFLMSFIPRYSFSFLRRFILRYVGGCRNVHPSSFLHGKILIAGSRNFNQNLHIGAKTGLSPDCFFDLSGPIHIGTRVMIGHNCSLVTGSHEIGPSRRRCGKLTPEPIHIGDGVWLGSGVTILPGVTIGRGAIVAAGAVVSRDVAPNTIVGGVPARFIREMEDDEVPVSG